MRRISIISAVALVAALLAAPAAMAGGGDGRLFVRAAVEHGDGTVTLPLHRGTSHGDDVFYVVLDSSDGRRAERLGANGASKLANAVGTSAVQRVAVRGGVVDFPATVDFAPMRDVTLVAPGVFPPAAVTPGSVGEPGYSPLIQRPDGGVDNAPQVARDADRDGAIEADERHDKVVAIDVDAGTVTLRETDGFSNGEPVRYVSTDASDPLAATLEASTLAPSLDAAPFAGGDGTDSARASLAAFVNGQTGAGNPLRQGLNSAVAGDGDPLNVLAWTPNQGRYSPLWDVHLAAWGPADVASGENVRQTDFDDVARLARRGRVTAPDGSPFGASRIVVDCPIVAEA